MKQRLLQQLSFAKPLRLALVLFTLLLTLPQNVWGDTVTTYTFDQTATDKGNGTYSIPSNSGAYSWTIQDLASGHTPVTNALGFSDVPAGGNLLFTIYSDFTLTGAFVSARITYSYSNTSKQSVAIYKNTGSLNDALTYGNSTTQELVELTGSPKTIDLSSTQLDHQFFAGNRIVFYFSIEGSTTNGNGTISIQSIEITTKDEYGLTVAGTAVTASNAANVLGDGKVSYNATNNTLTLNGATIDYTSGDAITAMITNPLNIDLVGTNTISCGTHRAFNISNDLNFKSSGAAPGQLTITSTYDISTTNFYDKPDGANVTYANSLVAAKTGTNSLTISTSSSTPTWPENAKDDNDAIINAIQVGTENNETTLTMTYAAVSSYKYPLTVPSGSTVAYNSSATDVATVNASTGVVTILRAGTTKITAKVNNTTDYQYTLTVNKATGTISIKDNLQLIYGNATSIPDDLVTTTPAIDAVTNQSIPIAYTWPSSELATVNESAKTITANKLGAWGSQISADFHSDANYERNGNTVAPTCSLTVVPPAPEIAPIERDYTIEGDTIYYIDATKTAFISQSLNIPTEALQNGHSVVLKYQIDDGAENPYPENPTAGVTINSSCLLTSWVEVLSGTNSLVVKSEKAYARYVLRQEPTFELSYSPTTPEELKMGETLAKPTVTLTDENTNITSPAVTWSSSNTEIATVGETTGIVTPVRPCAVDETVTITASFAGNATCKAKNVSYLVKVLKGDAGIYFYTIEGGNEVPVNNTTPAFSATYGQAFSGPTFKNPNNLTGLTWSSNPTSVAEVDNSGNVTIKFPGTVIVTVTFTGNDNYNSASATYAIEVKPSAPTLSLESGAYYVGQKIKATPTVTGTDLNTSLAINDGTNTSYVSISPYTYTFSSVGKFTASATTNFDLGTNLGVIASETTTATIIINNEPTFMASVGQNSDPYDEENLQAGNVAVTFDVTGLPTTCKLRYYLGSDASKAVNFDSQNPIILSETTTVNAYIRYTDNTVTPNIVYDSAPISKTYTVKQELADPFGNDLNYKTYYLNGNYSLNKPEGIKVYIITGISGNSVTTSTINYIPQGIAVLLEKDGAKPADGYVAETYTGTAGNFSGNLLKHADAVVNTTGKEYVLYQNEFVKATGDIPDNKCYLDLSSVNASRGMYGIGDGSTSIRDLRMENEERDNWYDLQGRRIQQPTKTGLYIKNGKKVIVNTK